jgi:trk system potassium uptake protein TrkH
LRAGFAIFARFVSHEERVSVKRSLTPTQTLFAGFIVFIALGTVMLWLPVSTAEGRQTSFLDALFTSTSAVTTTGLITVDTGSHFSRFGQIVILVLIQFSGLGYMVFVVLIVLGVGGRFTIGQRLLLSESLAKPSTFQVKKFVKAVIIFTVVFELAGAMVMGMIFTRTMSPSDAAFSAVFHSISGFCTAGFSLNPDSFIPYSDHLLLNIVNNIVVIAGGIGFFVLYDIANLVRKGLRHNHPSQLTDHTKLVLTVSAALMVLGTAVIFVSEGGFSSESPASASLLSASFQSISASTTTGFNTIDIGRMQPFSLLFIILLMFVGASPGSTGGGIKTTTFGIVLLFVRTVLTNRDDITAFKRTISPSVVKRALGIALMAGLYVTLTVLALVISEAGPILPLGFEVASALSSAGLSTGVTSQLSVTGKILIMITMLIGRVGPLAIGYTLVGRSESKKYTYPNGNVMVG